VKKSFKKIIAVRVGELRKETNYRISAPKGGKEEEFGNIFGAKSGGGPMGL